MSRTKRGIVATVPAPWLLCTLLLLFLGACGSPTQKTIHPRGPEGRKIFIFAVDGVTWRVMDPLLQQGKLPNMARLIGSGASGELNTIVPAHSPIIWTSIATGKSPFKHGIKGFWYTVEEGEHHASQAEKDTLDRLRSIGYISGPAEGKNGEPAKALYHSGKRKALALWNILGRFDMRSDVIAWWVTYPAEAIKGRMISDRYIYNRFELATAERGYLYEDEGRNVYPEELKSLVEPLVVKVEDIRPEQMQRFIRGPVTIPKAITLHSIEDELRIVLAKDLSYVEMSRAMLDEEVPDLFTVYIQGTDIASHYFWKYLFPEEWAEKYPDAPVSAADVERYGQAINEYYIQADEWIGELLEYADENTTVVVLSDHGFETGRRTSKAEPAAHETVSGVHSKTGPPGILVMHGPDVREGVRVSGAHIYDIVPTLLTVLGLPVADDMDGRVLRSYLKSSADRVPADEASIPSYEPEAR